MKKKHYLLIAALSLSLTTTAAAATLTACKDTPEAVQVTPQVTGTYYYDDNGVEKTIEIGITSFTLDFGNGEKAGVYGSFTNGTIELLFDNSETATALFGSGTITLNYNGNSYTMYLRTDFTVNFDVDNGSAVASQRVTNGKKAARPASNPTRENSVFIDWYADSNYATPFDFENTVITANTTVYAKFITIDASLEVHTATFDLGEGIDENYPAIESVNRRFYNLPEAPSKDGNRFLGWWYGSYYDRDSLSSKYDNQEVYEDIVLYAVWESEKPAISVTEAGASWSVKGTNKSFDVVIKNAAGTVLKEQHSAATSIEYDFASAREGDYTVEVTVDGTTTAAKYKNKALARVAKSTFTVEGDFLAFAPIDTEHSLVEVVYYIDFECGNALHTHVHQRLNGAGFDFSNCLIRDGGYRFRITAEAVDYAPSVSEWSDAYDRSLEKVTGLTVDADKDEINWNAVPNAKGYKIELSNGTDTIIEELTKTSYDMRSLAPANWTIKVTPVNLTYHIPEAAETSYNKTRLASPANFTVTNESIAWDAVDGATGYTLYVNGTAQVPDLETNSFAIPAGLFSEAGKEYAITVVAKGATDSLPSNPVYIHDELGEINYEDGAISWNAVVGVTKFGVKVGDAEESFVTDGSNRADVNFNKSGQITITVTGYAGDGTKLTENTVTVEVHTVVFNSNGGTNFANQYKVNGDTVTLPAEDPARLGYTFLGWFNQSENGSKYNGATLVFDSANPTIYANWEANKYTVTLVVGANGTMKEETEYKITFGENFQLPTPESLDDTKEFTGWYTATIGGVQCTDNIGYGQQEWSIAQNTTLYAQWGNAGVSYTLKTNGKEYIASQGAGVNNLATVTVLATYRGLPVTDLASNAFNGCTSIKKLRLPSSLRTYVDGPNGLETNGSSFFGLSSLEEIEVYDAGGEKFFASVDGCLYSVANEELEELIYVPGKANRTGTFTVAEGTKRIAARALYSTADSIEEVVIPSSVTFIDTYAFSSMDKLAKVTFLPAANGQLGQALEVRQEAFYNNKSLKEITFPKRLAALDIGAFGTSSYSQYLQKIYIQELGAEKDKATNYYDLDGVLCKADEIIYCPRAYAGSFRVPSGISKIGERAFYECDSLTGVTFTAGVTEIGAEAFRGSGVASVSFDQFEDNDDLTIGDFAFYGCALTELVLPPNLKKMGEGAFGSNSSLTEVTVNANRDSLEYANKAFSTTSGTAYVKTVNFGKNVQSFNISGVFGSALRTVNIPEENSNYRVSNGAIYNRDYTQMLFNGGDSTELVIADEVEVIGASLFKGNTNITSLVIGTGVKRIEESAFEGCTSIESIVFKAGGTESLYIGDRAFYNCSGLKTLEFNGRGGAEITIGKEAFAISIVQTRGEFLSELTLPEGVKSIGKFAFASRGTLETVNFPASLESIGKIEVGDEYPLSGSSSYKLTAVSIPTISAFRSVIANFAAINVAEGNPNFASIDGVLYEKENGSITTLLFMPAHNKAKLLPDEYKDPEVEEEQYGYFEVPEFVTRVADYAFYNNQELKRIVFKGKHDTFELGSQSFYAVNKVTSLTLPSGLTTLAAKAFYLSSSLEEITIPNTVTSIGPQAFGSCQKLAKVIFEEGNDGAELTFEDCLFGQGTFFGCSKLTELKFPKRTKKIGNYICSNVNGALTTIEIPVTVESIGQDAFRSCSKVTSLTFVGTVTAETADMTIGENAFNGCKLSEDADFALPANVTSLGSNALAGTGLKNLVIPARVTSLGTVGCTTLEKVTFTPTEVDGKKVCNITSIGANTFNNIKTLATIENFEYCTKLTEIPTSAFSYTALTTFTVPENIETIGASAFAYSASLASINFTKNESGKSKVKSIGNYAFRGTGLESFVFPTLEEGSLELGMNLFEGCSALTSLTISSSVQSIGSALVNAPAIENIITEEGAGVVADKTYNLMFMLTSTANRTYQITSSIGAVPLDKDGKFVIPSSYQGGTINEIAAGAFSGQNAMKGIVIPETVQIIGDRAFSHCIGLETVEFSGNSTLMSIGASAFEYTYNLRNVTLPNSLKSIGTKAFYVSGIEEVTMPDELTVVGRQIFQECGRLVTVNNISKMDLKTTGSLDGNQMFQDCASLKNVSFAEGANILPSEAFRECVSLERIDLTGITSFSRMLGSGTTGEKQPSGIFAESPALKEVVLDARLTGIPSGMFYNCTSLDTIYRSDTPLAERREGVLDLSQITTFTAKGDMSYEGAFQYCTSIKEVDLSRATGFNTEDIFYGCTNLKKVILAGAGYTSLANYMFYNCTSLKQVYYDGYSIPEENKNDPIVVLPDRVEYLGTYTFRYSGIEKVILPASLQVIGANAETAGVSDSSYLFSDCAALKEVIVSNELTKFGAYVFQNCVALDTIRYRTGGTVTGEDRKITLPSDFDQFGNYCFSGCTSLTEINIPHKNLTLGSYCFNGCTNLTTVNLAGATTLGSNAFTGCSALSAVTLPNVSSIGSSAFQNCTNLKAISLPLATSVGSSAFAGCTNLGGLLDEGSEERGKVDLPKATSLGASCFESCVSLETINIPQVTNVGNYCFSKCSSLKKIDISKATTIGTNGGYSSSGYVPTNGMFFNCTNLEEVKLNDNITLLGQGMFAFCTKLKTITLPAKLKATNTYTFYGSGITSITLPSEVKYIGATTANGTPSASSRAKVFAECASLTSITVSDKFIGIGVETFLNCGNLKSFNVSGTNTKFTTIRNNAFDGCTSLDTIDLSKVTTYGTTPFTGCTSLKKVTVKALAANLFDGCTALNSVTFDSSLKTIADYAFRGCTALQTIDLTGITSIGNYAFDGCTALTTVTLDGALTALGSRAFIGCTLLSTIYRSDLLAADAESGTEPTAEGDTAEGGGTEGGSAEEKVLYRDAFLNKADLTALTSIGARAFQNCKALTAVVLNDNLTEIGDTAFYNCSNLVSINMPSKLKTISSQAFLSCSGLTALEIPASVTSIGTNLFVGCTNLKLSVAAENENFAINEKGWLVNKKDNTVLFVPPQTIGEDETATDITEVVFADGAQLYGYMFNGYDSVQKIGLPSDLKEIPNYAFWNFGGGFGADFAIPAGVKTIGNGAFQNTSVSSLVIPEGVTSIGDYAFAGCTSLTEITLPSTLRNIGANAFDGCTQLTIKFSAPQTPSEGGAQTTADEEAEEEDTGLTIGDYAFRGCTGLTGNLLLPDGIVSIGNNCFEGCTGITGITFGKYLTKVGDYAFSGCTNMTYVTFGAWTAATDTLETSVGDYAFNNCSNLENVTFSSTGPKTFRSNKGTSSSLKNRDTFTFNRCEKLTTVTLGTGLVEVINSVFTELPALKKVELPDTVTTFASKAFYNCPNLESIKIPYSVTSIGGTAFCNCVKLANITFGETPNDADAVNLSIGDGAASTTPTQYLLQNEIGYSYQGAFAGCTALKSFAAPARLKTIGAYAFMGSGITSVTLNDGLDKINSFAFAFTKIPGVAVPYTVSTIASNAFARCSELSSVTFKETPKDADAVALTISGGAKSSTLSTSHTYYSEEFAQYVGGAFVGCAKLTEINLPGRLKTVGSYAFVGTGLTKVTTNDGTTEIDDYAFAYCTSLSDITIASTMAELSSGAFMGCTGISELVIPVSLKAFSNVFVGWTKEQKILFDLTGSEYEIITVGWFSNAIITDAVFGTTRTETAPEEVKTPAE